MQNDAMVVIAAIALVTYATRAGGLWFVSRFKPSPRVGKGLAHLPGAVLISLNIGAESGHERSKRTCCSAGNGSGWISSGQHFCHNGG